jgi:preprotein translocase subunit SecY
VFKKIATIVKNREVFNRIIFTLVILFVFKIGSSITIPRVDASSINYGATGGIFELLNMFGGGALSSFSIFALGVSPYITASIVVNLLSKGVLPKLEELSKSGEQGKRKIDNVTRMLTLVLAGVQAYGIILTMQNNYGLKSISGAAFTVPDYIYLIIVIVAGTFLLMWMADQITVKGVGNGLSMIIFAGIIMQLPFQISTAYRSFVTVGGSGNAIFNGIINFAIYCLCYIGLIIFVIFMEKSVRKIPMQYAGSSARARTKDVSFLPIKVNSAGVIPVIFASSILTAPPIIMSFLGYKSSHWLYKFFSIGAVANDGVPWGTIFYIILIFIFAYFYTMLQMDPEQMAENFQKSGAYIPGVRPGKETEKYLKKIIYRVTLIGAIFLVLLAGVPMFLTMVLGLSSAIAFGGTGLIIVVGVATETAQQVDGLLAGKEYQGFIG